MAMMKLFQEKGRDALVEIFKTNSRAFLADEAGLGKTFTSAGVVVALAEKQWERQMKNGQEPTPFYALYVGPNKALLEKCCNDIVAKTGGKVEYVSSNLYALLRGSIGHLRKKRGAVIPAASFNATAKQVLDGNISRYVALRREKRGLKAVYQTFHADVNCAVTKTAPANVVVFETFWKNAVKTNAAHLALDYDRISYFRFNESGKKIILYATSINLMGETGDGTEDERKYLRTLCKDKAWVQQNLQGGTLPGGYLPADVLQDGRCVVDALKASVLKDAVEKANLSKFGIVMFDEYHRYFDKLGGNAKNVAAIEKETDLKVLYISATPYQANKSDMPEEEVNLADDTEELNTLPTLQAFAKLFVGDEPELKIDLCKLDETYKAALQDEQMPHAGKETARNALQAALSSRMVRHERTLLSAGATPEAHTLLFADKKAEDYVVEAFNMRGQILGLEKHGFCEGAQNWSQNMPWILSFSTRYKTYDPFECLCNDALQLSAKDAEALFLNSDADRAKIATLPQQNIAFRQMCDANLKGTMSQLIWLPPTIPTHDLGGIFATHKTYSKLLVFGEYKYIQRGGALLLSQFADFTNQRTIAGAVLAQAAVTESAPEFAGAAPQDIKNDTWGFAYNDKKIPELYQADLPYQIAIALGFAAELAQQVHESFMQYFNRPQIKHALLAWMQGKIGDKTTLLQQYCYEGNLYAVMKEWKENAKQEFTAAYIHNILNRDYGSVHLQTYGTYYKESDGIKKDCGFAERLTLDPKDIGQATGADAEKQHKLIQDAFNAPFYPFVLFAGRGAQEGFDFHTYCLRIMHMTLPRGAVSFDQRQGRIDRYGSLLVRRRAVEVLGVANCNGMTFDDIYAELAKTAVSVWQADQLFPQWQIKEHEEGAGYTSNHHFERIVPAINYMEEHQEYSRVLNYLASYRSTIGSSGLSVDKSLVVNLQAL